MNYSVLDTMTCDLITVGLNESLEAAYNKMNINKIRHLPVVTELGEIIGIISNRDVFQGMEPNLGVWHSSHLKTGEFDASYKVKAFMSCPVKTVPHDTDLREVIHRMIKDKISAFLVTHKNKITGIVTSEDLLKLLYELLEDKFFVQPSLDRDAGWIGNLISSPQ